MNHCAVIHELQAIHQSLHGCDITTRSISWSDLCDNQVCCTDPETNLCIVDLSNQNRQRVVTSVVKAWAQNLERTTFNISQIGDCQFVAEQIASCSDPTTQVSVCGNTEKGIQGIMVWSSTKTDYFIDYLLSHPLNLPIPFTSFKSRIRGIGGILINHLKEKCHAEKKSLELIPLDSQIPYYEKQGFRLLPTDIMKWSPPESN